MHELDRAIGRRGGEVTERDRQRVEREGDGRRVEIGGREDQVVRGHDERVVGRRVDLGLDGCDRRVEARQSGAVDLREGAEAQGVLDRA